MALGLLGRGRGGSRGGFTPRGRGRGRGSYAVSHVIDRRTKQLVVMGFLLTEKEDVVNHLSVSGTLLSNDFAAFIKHKSCTIYNFFTKLHPTC